MMAFGEIPRIERLSSPSTCLRVTLVLFVALSLVGVWMLTSWTIVPLEFFPEETMKSELNKENFSVNTMDNSNVGQHESNKKSSKQKENIDDVGMYSEKDNVHTEDVTKEVVFPVASQSEILNETNTQVRAWSTHATKSRNEKELQAPSSKAEAIKYNWKLCNVTAGADYIPCLDNEESIKRLPATKHYEHLERHCPKKAPTCLVALPNGYRMPIKWPNSRDKIWYCNVPHQKLVESKAAQNWVRFSGEYLTFPGGGTQFKFGASHYIDIIQKSFPDIAWGERSRVILDVGCGVASFGGYQFDRDVLTMSFAPKDEHEAQVQLALERGIPAILAVMGTKRLPFPGMSFDVIHCARCRVSWHIEGGMLLLELNRLLRPGGFFVWSATPVYQNREEDIGIWKAMSKLTKTMCWEMVRKTKDSVYKVGLVIFRKPSNNECYERRKKNTPPLCQEIDVLNAVWNVSLQACMHKIPVDTSLRGFRWPVKWPLRLEKTPYWLEKSQVGVYGKSAPEDFQEDFAHWKHVISKLYMNGIGINWPSIRNVMDMRSVYGGFAAALSDLKLWVMNVVPIDSPDTLPIIYERGLFGMYHDWCESFSTYPRTYDLVHADHLFSRLKIRCELLPVMFEVDRILRPQGHLIVRDGAQTISEIEEILKSLRWEIKLSYSKENDGFLCMQKKMWRPKEHEICRSPVFKAMLENEMEESKTRTIKIHDVSYEVLRTFVKYLYTAEVLLDEEMACNLLVLAEKYQVKHLKAFCEKFMTSKVNSENAIVSYAFAHQHGAKQLIETALSLIVDNMGELTQRDEYKELVEKDPRLVVEIYEAYLTRQVNTAH